MQLQLHLNQLFRYLSLEWEITKQDGFDKNIKRLFLEPGSHHLLFMGILLKHSCYL